LIDQDKLKHMLEVYHRRRAHDLAPNDIDLIVALLEAILERLAIKKVDVVIPASGTPQIRGGLYE
jgi:hypothetical protein